MIKMYKSKIISTNDPERISDYISAVMEQSGIEKKDSPDIKYLDNTISRTISIKQVREMINWANLKPYNSEMKLGIIYNAEHLTIEAQNSLLKILEEPNRFTQIILCTNNFRQLLPTILSRCDIELFATTSNHEENKMQEFISFDLADKFVYIEQIIGIKDKNKRSQTVNKFFYSLLEYYRNLMFHDPSSEKVRNNIHLISETAKKINYNVPIKLSLENLVINLIA